MTLPHKLIMYLAGNKQSVAVCLSNGTAAADAGFTTVDRCQGVQRTRRQHG